ncbi:YrhK family protein [Actinomycetospora flava]|uniref:YrhK family protein n=1 Tax=Actinomycetospora flava TaxID=3129232 RepID=A0ABU8LYX4_9PSEU
MLLLIYIRHIRRSAHDYPWVHLGVALFGNFAFVVGSIFFLYPALTRTGTWLFVVASWGMLIGVIGEILARYEAKQRRQEVARVAEEVAAVAEAKPAT